MSQSRFFHDVAFKEKIIYQRIWGTTAAQEIQNLSYLHIRLNVLTPSVSLTPPGDNTVILTFDMNISAKSKLFLKYVCKSAQMVEFRKTNCGIKSS